MTIARISQRFGTARARRARAEEVEIAQRLTVLAQAPPSPGISTETSRLQASLQLIQEHKFRGAAIRGRVDWLLNHEHPCKRFYATERRQRQQRQIPMLREGAAVFRTQESLQQHVFQHFSAVFSNPESADGPESDLSDLLSELPSLSPAAVSELNQPITAAEIQLAFESLQSGKAPGADGLTKIFYQRFWGLLKPILLRCFQTTFQRGILSPMQRTGSIVLLPKSQDPLALSSILNWRPITLLNVDYKIYAKVLANRLKVVLPDIIGPQQTCAISGRSIFDTQLFYKAVIEWAGLPKRGAVMLSLDLQKAFDNVRHDYLFQVVQHLAGPGPFMTAIRACYTWIVSHVSVNGELTSPVAIRRSVRQGCPLSPYLFILQLEPILRRLQGHPGIHGLRLTPDSAELCYGAYADDIVLTLASKDSVRVAMQLFHDIAPLTGMVINQQKSVGLWLGTFATGPRQWLGFQWRCDGLRLLGVWMGHALCQQRNFADLQSTIEASCCLYGFRQLTLRGRVIVWNTYVLSRLWFRLRTTPITLGLLRRIDRLGALFVWHAKYEPTGRAFLQYPTVAGGLGMLSMCHRYRALRALQLCELTKRDAPWCLFYGSQLTFESGPSSFLSIRPKDRHCTPFARELLKVTAAFLSLQEDLPLDSWSLRTVYRQLLLQNVSVPRLIREHGAGPMRRFLHHVFRLPLLPTIRTLLFKVAVGILPTSVWLLDRGILPGHVTSLCLSCQSEESTAHVLFECPGTRRLWAPLRAAVPALPTAPDNWVRALPRWSTAATAVTGCVVAAVWQFRNARMFRGDNSGTSAASRLRSLLLYHVNIDKARLEAGSFRRCWPSLSFLQDSLS